MNGTGKKHGSRTAGNGSSLGLVLIGLGALLLLSNLGIIGGFGNIVGLAILGAMGGFLLHQHYTGRGQMWLLIGGFILLGCAAATVTGNLAGAWFLGIAGLGFLQVWREDERQWWALLPGGTFFTLAAVVVADNSARWLNGGTVFFAGLALTFLALYMLPRHAQSWAIIPATASAGLALLIWGSTGSWLLPLILIVVGMYLVGGTSRRIPRGFNYGGSSGRRPNPEAGPDGSQTDAGSTAAERREVAQLPEDINSTGPEIPERWTEPGNGTSGEAPRNG